MFFRRDDRSTKSEGANGSGVPSLISVDLRIRGDVVSLSDLHIDGVLEGEVVVQNLIIGEKAEITGAILGVQVVVRGRVIGNIRAKRLHLHASAHVQGDLEHESLSVEAGAHLEGSCRHVKEGIDLPPIIEERLARKTPRLPPPQTVVRSDAGNLATDRTTEDEGANPGSTETERHPGEVGGVSRSDRPSRPADPLSSF